MNLKSSTMNHLDDLVIRYPVLDCVKESIEDSVKAICQCYYNDGKVMVCGNGGSAADSEHIVGELMKSFKIKRNVPDADVEKFKESGITDWAEITSHLEQGIAAIALTVHSSLNTAIVNDTHPDMPFAQQVYVYGKPNDVLIGLSTSGNAKNVVAALKVARVLGVKTIGLTGEKKSLMDEYCDISIKVPESQTFLVQELHLPVYHTICMMVEQEIF